MNYDSFSKMRAQVGGALVEMHVILLLKEAMRFFGSRVSDHDLAFYAKRITLDYHYWRMEDLTICLNNGIAGKYGVSNKNWSYSDTFILWATAYDVEWDEARVELRKEQQKQLQNVEVKNPVAVEEFTKLAKRFEAPKAVKTHNVQTRERNKVDEYIDQFEAMNDAQNKVKSATGYVEYMGRRVDINEYINIKMDETN